MATKKPSGKFEITGLDELLKVPEHDCKNILISSIQDFRNHPFRVVDDAKMDELVESIKENGVMTPVIVRKIDDRTYEMISGHRRTHAAERAGLYEIPAIVKDIDDDEAVVMMVDSNIQREEILPSERAWAFKMKMDAMRRSAGRHTKENSGHNVHHFSNEIDNLKTHEKIGEQSGITGRQVQRYIRLTELIPPLLNMVDQGKLAMTLAVEMSYLNDDFQYILLREIKAGAKIKTNQVNLIRREQDRGIATEEHIMSIIGSEGKKEKEKVLVLPMMILNNYFPEGTPNDEIEETIYNLLDMYRGRGGTR